MRYGWKGWVSPLKWSYDNKIQVFSKAETGVGRAAEGCGGQRSSDRVNGPCLFLIRPALDVCQSTIWGVYGHKKPPHFSLHHFHCLTSHIHKTHTLSSLLSPGFKVNLQRCTSPVHLARHQPLHKVFTMSQALKQSAELKKRGSRRPGCSLWGLQISQGF